MKDLGCFQRKQKIETEVKAVYQSAKTAAEQSWSLAIAERTRNQLSLQQI